MSQFIEERCLIKPEATARAGDLYREYVNWAQQEGLSKADIFTSNRFGRRMSTKFNKSHSVSGKRYHGIGILTKKGSVSDSSPIEDNIEKEYKNDLKSVSYPIYKMPNKK